MVKPGRISQTHQLYFFIFTLLTFAIIGHGNICLNHSGQCASLQVDNDTISTNSTNYRQNHGDQRVIRIGGLFELGSNRHYYAQSELSAAMVAVKHVNENKIIGDFKLEIIQNNTKCDPGIATDVLLDLIYRKPRIIMFIGGACSDVTETLAELAPYWSLIMVSYASTSPALSERENYKSFFRLASTDSSKNPARTMFIQKFNWDLVGIVYENKEVYYLAINGLAKSLDENKIKIRRSVSFNVKQNEISSKIKELKNADVRIIIAGFSESTARKVFCQAFRHGMYGHRYVWVLMRDFTTSWWSTNNDTDCSVKELKRATDGYFIVSSLKGFDNNQMSYGNITVEKFKEDYREMNGTFPLSPYATSAYDAVWTVALTINETLQKWHESNSSMHLANFDYENGSRIMLELRDVMQNLSFEGLSVIGASLFLFNSVRAALKHLGMYRSFYGPVSFRGPDRRGVSVVSQNQNGEMKTVAMFDPENHVLNFNCSECVDIMWKGRRHPRDKVLYIKQQRGISDTVFFTVVCISLLGIIASLFFLWFNYNYRKLRYIKLSSPNLNNLAVFGCILVYLGVLLLGMDEKRMKRKNYPVYCTVRSFMFAAGFSLAFGSMFTKTYRVHQIFTRAHSGLIKSKLLQDKQLMIMIFGLLFVDCAMMVLWVTVDPMKRRISNLTTEASPDDPDIFFIYQSSSCRSNHMEKWLSSFYAFKGLLLIFGVYMAWETRNVKIPVLNDSQYIGMNVYNVVTMTVTVVVMSNILSKSPTLAFIVESTILLVSTSLTLGLLFIPKIYCIVTAKGEPIIASSGIMVEEKMRRFIVNDKREVYYRAEVQNRIYKREIIELEQEITRLERLLEMPVEPYPKMTTELMTRLPETRIDSFSQTPEVMRRIRRRSILINDEEVSIDGFDLDTSESSSSSESDTENGQIVSNKRNPLRMSIRNAATSTARRLSLWRKAIKERPDKTIKEIPEKEKSRMNNIRQRNNLTLDVRSKNTNVNLHRRSIGDSKSFNRDIECLNAKQKWRIMLTPESESEDVIEITSVSPDVSLETCIIEETISEYPNEIEQKSSSSVSDKKEQFLSFLLLNERRKRIQKLQTDIKSIHDQLVNLEELEYVVSDV